MRTRIPLGTMKSTSGQSELIKIRVFLHPSCMGITGSWPEQMIEHPVKKHG